MNLWVPWPLDHSLFQMLSSHLQRLPSANFSVTDILAFLGGETYLAVPAVAEGCACIICGLQSQLVFDFAAETRSRVDWHTECYYDALAVNDF